MTSHQDLTVRDCAPVAYVKRNGLFPVPGKGYVEHVPRHSGRRGGETAPGESS